MGNEGSKFSTGDIVEISDDLEKVRALQEGHGGWNNGMQKDLGKMGTVKTILPTGDVAVETDSRVWVLNPDCCKLVLSERPEREDSSSDDAVGATLGSLMEALGVSREKEEVTVAKRLVYAAQQGQIETVRNILQKSPNEVNSKGSGKTALHVASHKGHTNVVKVLLEAGASLDIKDNEELTALQCAVIGNRSGAVDLLLQKGANINAVEKAGDTPLHNAIFHGCTEVEPLLVHHQNLDFSIKNKKGFDVLQYAALRGDEIATKLILEKHPEMVDNKMADDGFSALHIAAYNGHDQVARLLIECGAELNCRDKNNRTPLHLAAKDTYQSMVFLLVEAGANVNAQDGDGHTPLHLAVVKISALKLADSKPLEHLMTGNKDETTAVSIACFLVKKGADLNMKDHQGMTPLDLVIEPAKKEALKMFAAFSS